MSIPIRSIFKAINDRNPQQLETLLGNVPSTRIGEPSSLFIRANHGVYDKRYTPFERALVLFKETGDPVYLDMAQQILHKNSSQFSLNYDPGARPVLSGTTPIPVPTRRLIKKALELMHSGANRNTMRKQLTDMVQASATHARRSANGLSRGRAARARARVQSSLVPPSMPPPIPIFSSIPPPMSSLPPPPSPIPSMPAYYRHGRGGMGLMQQPRVRIPDPVMSDETLRRGRNLVDAANTLKKMREELETRDLVLNFVKKVRENKKRAKRRRRS
jgi:hypothetical protein